MEGNEIKTIEKKSSKKTAIIITIMAIIILCLGGFIIYDKLYLEKQSEFKHIDETTTTTTTTTQVALDNNELTDDKKKDINKQIYDNLNYGLREIIDEDLNNERIKYNTNYLQDTQNKIEFIWQVVLQNENITKKYDSEIYGGAEDDIMGAAAISKNDFVKEYKKIFNENINIEKYIPVKNDYKISADTYSDNYPFIQDDVIYSSYVTGWGGDYFILKTKSMNYNKNNKTYELKMDLLTKFYVETSNNETRKLIDESIVSDYSEPTILDYPEDLIYAQAKLTLEKIDNRYVIKGLVFEK